MRTFFADLWQQLLAIWRKLDSGQRFVVLAVLLGSAVGLGGIVWYAGRPSYEEVFSATDADQLQEVRRALTTATVPYIADASGQGILVDRSNVGRANQAIFATGVRGGTSAKSAIGNGSIIEDSQTRTFRLDAAARAQAEAAIRQLDGVVAVTVSASRPKRSPFRDRDRETQPRATIVVRLRGATVFESVAKAAASQAASDLGMPMESVDVINATTHQRWTFDADHDASGGGGGASEFMRQQRELSLAKTKAAQQALDAAYAGKTMVTVNVELDPDWSIVNEKVLPTSPIVKSDRTSKDATENGTAGAASGDPSAQANSTEPNKGPSKKNETRTREYVTDIGERRSGKLAPDVKRLTVAVTYSKKLDDEKDKNGFDKDSLAKLVKTIVGYDSKRDGEDGFSMMSGDFAAEEPTADLGSPSMLDKVVRVGPLVGQIFGVLVVVLFLRSLFKRKPAAGRAATADAVEAPKDQTPEARVREMRREIERAITTDPAALARLLESWLAEQKT